jgi:two-component system LytT family response regulator
MIYSCLIIDDEVDERYIIRNLIRQHFPSLQILGEADNISCAEKMILSKKPNLLFLDIQMGNSTSFEILDKIHFQGQKIFITAHEKYAIQAIKNDATDYLLKPIHSRDFKIAVNKAFENLSLSSKKEGNFIFIANGNTKLKVTVNQILAIEGQGNYAIIHLVSGKSYTQSYTLKKYEEKVPTDSFIRVHRNFVVNIKHILSFDRTTSEIHLHNKMKVKVSRRNKTIVSNIIEE